MNHAVVSAVPFRRPYYPESPFLPVELLFLSMYEKILGNDAEVLRSAVRPW